jgi:beta-lactamase class A
MTTMVHRFQDWKYRLPFLLFLAFLFGALFHWSYSKPPSEGNWSGSKQVREWVDDTAMAKTSLINPLLECDIADGAIDAYKENFQEELHELTDTFKAEGKADTIAVYFRDLNNGPTFGIHADKDFIPASLLKVPVMMAYYKNADEDASILNNEIAYNTQIDFGNDGKQLIPPSHEIETGRTYTVNELITRAITQSDNSAITLLITNIDGRRVHELYKMLGVREDVLNGPNSYLTVKEYAAFFRILFNASYLSRKNSERALQLLTETEYKNGLSAGIPSDVLIAHKFGEGGDARLHQIHDCGIVYYPGHPYLLCVMSSGTDIKNLEKSIAGVSAFVYKKIDALNR